MDLVGWIKIHRKILDWEWYDDGLTFRLFMDLLLTANFEEKKWHGMTIMPGQIVTSYAVLAKRLGVGVQKIRTSIERLKSTGEITSTATNRFTLIEIKNWAKYQIDQQANQHSTNKQLTTTKEGKERKESPPTPQRGLERKGKPYLEGDPAWQNPEDPSHWRVKTHVGEWVDYAGSVKDNLEYR